METDRLFCLILISNLLWEQLAKKVGEYAGRADGLTIHHDGTVAGPAPRAAVPGAAVRCSGTASRRRKSLSGNLVQVSHYLFGKQVKLSLTPTPISPCFS